MLNRLKFGIRRTGFVLPGILRTPRVWVLLLLLAVPFFVVSAHYFESLERSGPERAVLADALFSASISGYVVLLAFLKQRKI